MVQSVFVPDRVLHQCGHPGGGLADCPTSPANTPSWSTAGQFWLTFHLPPQRCTGSTLGRMFSNSFAGIAPASRLGFVLAQAVGAVTGVALHPILQERNHQPWRECAAAADQVLMALVKVSRLPNGSVTDMSRVPQGMALMWGLALA